MMNNQSCHQRIKVDDCCVKSMLLMLLMLCRTEAELSSMSPKLSWGIKRGEVEPLRRGAYEEEDEKGNANFDFFLISSHVIISSRLYDLKDDTLLKHWVANFHNAWYRWVSQSLSPNNAQKFLQVQLELEEG